MRKLIKNISILLLLLTSCNSPQIDQLLSHGGNLKLVLASGEVLETRLAITEEEKAKGLSGVKEDQFRDNEAMLFFYRKNGMRQFWMPNTYFDLDIFFLDRKFRVKYIERNVKKHPGLNTPPMISKTRSYYCRYVLELKSTSAFAKKIMIGQKLNVTK